MLSIWTWPKFYFQKTSFGSRRGPGRVRAKSTQIFTQWYGPQEKVTRLQDCFGLVCIHGEGALTGPSQDRPFNRRVKKHQPN